MLPAGAELVEGDVVVKVSEAAARCVSAWLAPALWRTGGRRTAATSGVARGGVAFLLAAEHLHLVSTDLGGVAVLSILVLPFAGADRALDINLTALAQILAGDFGELSEEGDFMLFG